MKGKPPPSPVRNDRKYEETKVDPVSKSGDSKKTGEKAVDIEVRSPSPFDESNSEIDKLDANVIFESTWSERIVERVCANIFIFLSSMMTMMSPKQMKELPPAYWATLVSVVIICCVLAWFVSIDVFFSLPPSLPPSASPSRLALSVLEI